MRPASCVEARGLEAVGEFCTAHHGGLRNVAESSGVSRLHSLD